MLNDEVDAQFKLFEAELPALLKTPYCGKWVVYFNGIRNAQESEEKAMEWAAMNLGLDKGFVIAEVRELKPVLLSAALAYRFGT